MAEMTDHQMRYREFLELLPVTLALAGLPQSEPGKYYSDDQIESRLITMRHAYKHARNFVREVVRA
jgi:hypothetical protein